MSGFDPAWLDLREPADHRARNRALLEAVAARFAGRESVAVVDLGCGTGSNLRALSPHLPTRQRWTLVDNDPALLAAARARTAREDSPRVTVLEADLASDTGRVLADAPDLVTAAALFDLASVAFIERFADAVATRGACFYTVLSYDGRHAWDEPHPADAAVHAAFLAHQARDKGFGPAAGPEATVTLVRAFLARGYRVVTGDSPWVLGPDDAALIAALMEGVADAVRETGAVPEPELSAWLAARRAAPCVVGHQDVLALPSSRPAS